MGNHIIKQYYDNIYGYIDLRKDQFGEILRDPFFLRLHKIKQMGLTHYVFPDAVHSRFAHSLGVYFIVSRMINAQKRLGESNIISEEDAYKFQLSALLHDIGHLPLSHTIESALDDFDKFEQDTSGQHADDSSTVPLIENGNSKKPAALHEKLAENVLQASDIDIFLEKQNISSLDISAGFKGDFANASEDEFAIIDVYRSQIRNFLHSQLDADRIDYLLRDSSFSGLKTGGIDLDKIINSMVYDKSKSYGIDESAIHATDQFFLSRFVAYCQIVGNKNVMSFEYMAKDLYYRLLKIKKETDFKLSNDTYSLNEIKRDILPNRPDIFLRFTDDYFFAIVNEVLMREQEIKKIDPMIIRYAERITRIEPMVPITFIEYFSDLLSENCFIDVLRSDEEMKRSVCEEAGIQLNELIIPNPLEVKMFKNDEDLLQVFSKNIQKCDNISKHPASILHYLGDKKIVIQRIYTLDWRSKEQIRKVLSKYAKDYKFSGDLCD